MKKLFDFSLILSIGEFEKIMNKKGTKFQESEYKRNSSEGENISK